MQYTRIGHVRRIYALKRITYAKGARNVVMYQKHVFIEVPVKIQTPSNGLNIR